MQLRRVLRRVVFGGLIVLAIATLLVGTCWVYFHPTVQRTDAIAYGERNGTALCFDVLRPKNPNGLGIVVMVSGGWKSKAPGTFPAWFSAPLLRRGYTVFPVYHVSQPQATVMEIAADVHRAVRFIRHHARDYGSIRSTSASRAAAPADT